MLSLVPLALFGLVPASAGPAFGGAGGSVPPDPFAHPRFALSFLNDLPIGRSFADALVRRQENQQQQRGAASEELLTTQAELGRPAGSRVADLGWFFASGPAQASLGSRGEIAGASMPEGESDGVDEREPLSSAAEHRRPGGGDGLPPVGNHTLQTFLLPPSRSYLCLLPPPASSDPTSPSTNPPVEADEPAFDPDLPERLLRHLSSSCLFVRAGWFTYSYCHNGEVRQFREKTRSSWPPAADAWVPVVDEEYDDYVLGRATVPPYGESFDSTSFDPSSQLGSRARAPHFDPRTGTTGGPTPEDEDDENDARRPIAPITLARGAGARYLTTRWGGGTTCDQTGDAREIEIQYHCSSRGTDALSLIKETSTCSYVLRLETPRLCGVPGFSGDWGKGEVGQVACREIVEDDEVERRLTLGASETSKDRTPLPSWALLPPALKRSTADESNASPLQQQEAERTPEQEATRLKWLEILKGQTAVLDQPVKPDAPAPALAGAATTDDVQQQTASQQFESRLNELLQRALAISDGAAGEGEDRAAAVRALERAGAELASQHMANTARVADTVDEESAVEPLAGLSDWLSQAIVEAHTKSAGDAETGTAASPFLVDLDLNTLSDDDFYALFPDGLEEGDDQSSLVYVTLEEDPEAEGGWSVQLAAATDEGDFEADGRAGGPRDEL